MAARKKIAGFIVLIIFVVAAFTAWRLFGSNTNFNENKKNFYVNSGSTFEDVMKDITRQDILKNPGTFRWVSKQLGYDTKVRAGRYVIEQGTSIYGIVKMLRSGRQTAINLVINKLRTKEDFAKKIAANFECDSIDVISLLNNNDSLYKYRLDTNTAMTAVIPNTYSFMWNTPAHRIFKKLFEEHEIFWNDERKKKAAGLNLTPQQAYILASIVEEETNKDEDKGKIASVYLNRIETGMHLGADPTVKFAMRDFGLKRIYHKHLQFPSPYNTYLQSGLPPGPICTPSTKTIDAVLNSPTTSYLYFVARPDLRGYSNFSVTYDEHLRNAKAYQMALDSLIRLKDTTLQATD